MPTGAINSEDYSISDARTGSIRLSRLVLTGWGAAPTSSVGLFTWSDQGRMWGVYTASSADLSFYRRSTAGSADKVCSGTVSSGTVTLAQANSSGISGTADVDNGTPGTNPTEDSTFDVVVSYCDERELFTAHDAIESYLESGSWQGEGTRFEALLIKAKRILDQWMVNQHNSLLVIDKWQRYMLAHIVNQQDIARTQALVACHLAIMGRSGFIDGADLKAETYMNLARQAFKAFTPAIDYQRNMSRDYRVQYPGSIIARRG